jgi:hypoxanthine-guanine phosphoribosyltransferase
LTKDIVDRIDSFTDSEKYIKIEVVKKSISEIGFNWSKFEKYCENHNVPVDARSAMQMKMEKMLDEIHALDYFSIAKNIKGQKYKRFLNNIYKFYDDKTVDFIKTIKNKNILVIDDIYTSGVTIEQIIKAYQMLDPDDSNVLTVFTLLGKDNSYL